MRSRPNSRQPESQREEGGPAPIQKTSGQKVQHYGWPSGFKLNNVPDSSLGNQMEPKWRINRSKTVVQDRWINVRADHCTTAEGAEISPYYVMSYPDWVHVVGITKSNRLVLVRQYRHAAGEFFLELPGGAVDPGDASLKNAAQREFEEETGFSSERWEWITSLHSNPATHTNRVHFFLAHDAVCDRPQRLDIGEAGLKVELVDISVVLGGLKSGLLGQAMQVSGVLLGLAAAGRLTLTAT
jgi:8-oxo-dGTP pyrophosphatase MutT (NUDIX family)